MMKKKLLVFAISCCMACTFSACGTDSDDSYKETFESGMDKYYKGESMTKEEYNAVKGFKDWEAKQGEKTYDQWDK